MMNSEKTIPYQNYRIGGILLFALGALIASILLAVSVWGDLEASNFNPPYIDALPLKSLSCPVIMTRDEVSEISAKAANSLDHSIKPTFRTQISEGNNVFYREMYETITLKPGETQKLSWTVSSQDAVYGRLIFARVVLMNTYPLQDKQASCGVFITRFPYFTGTQIFIGCLVLSGLMMIVGGLLWLRSHQSKNDISRNTYRAILLISITLITGMISSLMGGWLIGGVLFLGAVILMVSIALYRFSNPRDLYY